MIHNLKKAVFFLMFPFTMLAAWWVKRVMRFGIGKREDDLFMRLDMLPVLGDYYQPLINPKKHLERSLRADRYLPGIDMNVTEQLELLAKFNYNNELMSFPLDSDRADQFHYNNSFYGSGDAEYLYNIVRHFKPGKIIEIGSGYSTLMAQNAVKRNQQQDAAYHCAHICIEPYEQPWLEQQAVEVRRERVETFDLAYFQQLGPNDILFIDSTHIIRPQGDVLFEYLEFLPLLKPGVIIHIHDIFMPKDYPDEWIYSHRLWNEQYLLEAFLTFNSKFKIIGALNYLQHNHNAALCVKAPVLAQQPSRETGAFWMIKTA